MLISFSRIGFSKQRNHGWGEIEISTEGVVDRREEGGGGEKKNTPARSHCPFGKLRSWANGVSDWCGVALIG